MRFVVYIALFLGFGSQSFAQIELAVQKGHSADIVLLEFSHSNRYLASLAENNEIIIWEIQHQKSVSSFSVDPNANILGMRFDIDEKKLLVRLDSMTLEYDQVSSKERLLDLPGDTNYRKKDYYFQESSNYKVDIYQGAIRKKQVGKRFRSYNIAVTYLNAPFTAFDVSPTADLIVGVAADNKTYVNSYSTGRSKKILGGHFSANNDVRFSKDGKFFATAGKDRSIIIWDSKKLVIKARLATNVFRKKTALFSYDGDRIYVGDELGYVYEIDFRSAFPTIKVAQPNLYAVNSIKRAGADDHAGYLLASSNNFIYHKYNLASESFADKYEFRDLAILKAKKRVLQATFNVYQEPFGEPTILESSPNNKLIVYTGYSDNPNVTLADVATKKIQHFYNPKSNNQWVDAGFVNDSVFMAIQDSSNILFTWKKVGKDYFQKTDTLSYLVKGFEYLSQNKVWMNTYDYGQIIYDLETRKSEEVMKESAENIFKRERFVVVATEKHNLVFYNTVEGKVTAKLKGHTDKVTDVDIHPEGRLIISSSDDGTVKLWSFENNQLVSTMIPFRNNEFVFANNENYYMMTKGAMDEIGFKYKGQFFYPEQFDLKYNRPDLVLSDLGYSDSSLIKAYHSAYLKRLKKMNFKESQLSDDFHLPELEIKNQLEIAESTLGSSLLLKLELKDTKHELDRLNVWINDVAIYGTNGINLRDKNTKSLDLDLTLDLGKGNNKIELGLLNSTGAESYRKELSVESSAGKQVPDLYVVSLGVSKHKNEKYNLSFADKDAKDLSKTLEQSPYFANVYSKIFVNEEVTLENLAQIEPFLAKADINDVVLVFVAGHGVLDDNFDYFFASHDMDFANPAARGIPYSKIEELLDGIKALKKLLFLDTCHSGELDKDEIKETVDDENEDGELIFRRAGRSVNLKDNPLGLQSTNELMKSLFTDLRKGTGATVISSSGGAELSIEGGDYKNGLFTYCLIQGLTTKAADSNKDKMISVAELQKYVQTEVSRLSKGLQTPTSRIQNNELDYRLW